MGVRLCLRWLVLLVLAGGLAACERVPDAPTLQQEIQRRLDEGFEKDVLRIRSFRRAGSAPFQDTASGASGRLVYYAAELELLQDFDLASWRGLNLGSLLYLLGATEQGLSGFHAGGNRKGDVLGVYGRAFFRERDGEWQPALGAAPATLAPADVPTLEGVGTRGVLSRVRGLLESPPPTTPSNEDVVVREELARATSAIDTRLARARGFLLLATGQPGMTFHTVGSAFARFATEQGLDLHASASEGSLTNCLLVENRQVEVAFSQNDVAETLFEGWQAEGQGPQQGLRALLSLWPVAVQLVTLESSDVRGLRDLAGRRVAIGALGSGAHFTTRRLGLAAGIRPGDLPHVEQVRLKRGLALLDAEQVDAVLLTEPIPMTAVQDLASRRRLRLVPIESDVIEALVATRRSYFEYTIPARTYPGQPKPVRTLGLTAMLIANASAADALVERLLEQVFASVAALEDGAYRVAFIRRQTARQGVSIPLHPAAERYLGKVRE
jgi:TRAP transporter TAXI family solute receptor